MQFPIELTLWAQDGGTPPLRSFTNLTITVRDINDNGPIFNLDVITISITEATPANTIIKELTNDVIDIDSGINAIQQFYIISGNTGIFDLQPNGTLTLLQTLDRETTPVHSLQVFVQDAHRSTEFNDLATIEIIVLDANDNNPMFSQDQYTISVSYKLTLS